MHYCTGDTFIMGFDRHKQDLIGNLPGAPKYHPSYVGRVRDMSYLGATDSDIASLFGITTSTLKNWRDEHPEFDAAWQEGQVEADSKVAAAFYKRAVGYSYVSSRRIEDDGTVHENISHVKPDVNACTKWLAVRQPEKWGRLIGTDSGAGSPQQPSLSSMLLSDTEIARKVAFLLAKAVNSSQDNTVTIDGSIEHGDERPDSSETK